MLLKPSIYNIIVRYNQNRIFVFNSLSTALMQVDENLLKYLNNEKIEFDSVKQNDKFEINQLIENKFFVRYDINELDILKSIYHSEKYSKAELNITITPTLDCNLKCIYCFEKEIFCTRNELYMSDKVENEIIKYIQNNIESNNQINKLNITWFGGEPLLCIDQIVRMTEKINNIALKNNIFTSYSIVTNGVLLNNDDVYEKAKICNINSYQITLDGNEKIHNTRRVTKGGYGTFKEIITAIKRLKFDNINFGVRVNIDKNNINSVFDLIDQLKKDGLQDIHIYLGHLRAYTNSCINESIKYLSVSEFSKYHTDILTYLKYNGFCYSSVNFYPTLARPCIANRKNSFVIDNNANIYKCRTDIGNQNSIIGNLFELSNRTEEQIYNEIKWIEWEPFNSVQCNDCKYMPLCLGGCAYCGIKNKTYVECNEWRYFLDFYIKELISNYINKE